MQRLNVFLADPEADYMKALADYIRDEHPNEFRIFTFSNTNSLDTYLQQNPIYPDVILCNALFGDFAKTLSQQGTVSICLDDGKKHVTAGEWACTVSKYARADSIVRELIMQCNSPGMEKTDEQTNQTKHRSVLAAMISSCGGSGKTTIALGLCLCMADMGTRILYLNLESISSAPAFFPVTSESSMTNMLLGIKEGPANLLDRIKSSSTTDSITAISYFSPSENCIELDSITTQEMEDLISCVKSAGLFDAIVVDLPAGLGGRTLSVLGLSDLVFCVVTDKAICRVRTDNMMNDMERIFGNHTHGLTRKIRFIENMRRIDKQSDFSMSARQSHDKDRNYQVDSHYEQVRLPYEQSLERLNSLSAMKGIKPFYDGICHICGMIGNETAAKVQGPKKHGI